VVVVVVIGLMVKGTRILVVDPPKSWLRVPQKVCQGIPINLHMLIALGTNGKKHVIEF